MTTSGGVAPFLGVARVAGDVAHELAEGPVWDPVRSCLLWVDILEGAVWSGGVDAEGAVHARERILFPGTAGAVAIAADGEIVVAGTDRLHVRAVDGAVTSGPALLAGLGRRFNDAKPDPRGLLVAGTKGEEATERLMRFEEDGSITVIDDDLGLSNGIGWSPDGARLYSVDTLRRRVYVRAYDVATGGTGVREEFAAVPDAFPDALPDGLAVDAEGCVWLALWGAGRVIRLSPAGEVLGVVEVDAPHVSSLAFSGADLRTLVITTARENLTPDQQRAYPYSGYLFSYRSDVAGAPVALWSGRPA